MDKMNIALFVNAPSQAGWVHEIAQFLLQEPGFHIAALIIIQADKPTLSQLFPAPRRPLRAVAKLESRILKTQSRAQLETRNLQKSLPPDTPLLSLKVVQTGAGSLMVEPQQLDVLRELGLDVILALGVPVIRGEFVQVPTHGVWVPAYSEWEGKGGVAHAGFWEVYRRADHTAVKLWRLGFTEEADELLDMRSFNTKEFWLKNRARALKLGNLMVFDMLHTIVQPAPRKPSVSSLQIHTTVTHPAPAQWDSGAYLARQVWLASGLALRRTMKRHITWRIGMCQTGRQHIVTSDAAVLVPPKGRFFADPFVYTYQGQPFIFFEDYYFCERKGKVSVATYVDGNFQFLGVVLDLPYHLSFPYIFEYEGNIYMVPETSSNRTIEMWKCVEFPMKWERHVTLMENVSAADTIIFPYGSYWWLFTNIDRTNGEDHCDELFAFYSTRPDSFALTAHKLNPIITNPIKARNGGMILDQDGSVIRCAQRQGFRHYGKGVSLNRIEELTPETYREAEGPVHYPHFLGKTFSSMHHWHHRGGYTVFDFAFIE
jgi:hypothetical protein